MADASQAAPIEGADSILHGIYWSIGLNTAIPVLLYEAAKRWVTHSEYVALLFATLFPVGEGLWGLLAEREMDPIGLVVLAGIAVDAGAMALGGSPRVLLLRESLFTGAFGIACFISLLLRRPLMFYFGRYFMSGRDPDKRARFEASWALPEVRHGNRLVTSIWGIVFTGELCLRVLFVYTLEPAVVLIISPLVLGVFTVVTVVWSLAYARRMRQRVLPRVLQL